MNSAGQALCTQVRLFFPHKGWNFLRVS